jgi:hypothetical protein
MHWEANELVPDERPPRIPQREDIDLDKIHRNAEELTQIHLKGGDNRV